MEYTPGFLSTDTCHLTHECIGSLASLTNEPKRTENTLMIILDRSFLSLSSIFTYLLLAAHNGEYE